MKRRLRQFIATLLTFSLMLTAVPMQSFALEKQTWTENYQHYTDGIKYLKKLDEPQHPAKYYDEQAIALIDQLITQTTSAAITVTTTSAAISTTAGAITVDDQENKILETQYSQQLHEDT